MSVVVALLVTLKLGLLVLVSVHILLQPTILPAQFVFLHPDIAPARRRSKQTKTSDSKTLARGFRIKTADYFDDIDDDEEERLAALSTFKAPGTRLSSNVQFSPFVFAHNF